MSPLSRKRKPKKQRRVKPAAAWLSSASAPPPRTWPWWPQAVTEVLTGAGILLTTGGPAELEQRTAELIGGVLHDELRRQDSGFMLNAWLDTLIEQTVAAAGPPAMRLLHGIAAIAPRGQAENARRGISALRGQEPLEPAWLATTPLIRPTGEVRLLRDAYGARFGLVMACAYPDPALPASTYLLDVDMCAGVAMVVDADVHPGPDEACAAWRALVGLPAADASPGTADFGLLADLLPTSGVDEAGVMGDESRRQMDNYFRMTRRSDDLVEVLAATGVNLPDHRRWWREARDGLDIAPFLADFRNWNEAQGGPAGDDISSDDPADLVDLADAWLEGSLPETRLACSPHRIQMLRERIAIEWPHGAGTRVVKLLPAWVRWCAERTGLDPRLAARALAVAETEAAAGQTGSPPSLAE